MRVKKQESSGKNRCANTAQTQHKSHKKAKKWLFIHIVPKIDQKYKKNLCPGSSGFLISTRFLFRLILSSFLKTNLSIKTQDLQIQSFGCCIAAQKKRSNLDDNFSIITLRHMHQLQQY